MNGFLWLPCACVWNREFSLSEDIYAQDSIELLKQSGIDFAKNEARGIHVERFGELLMTSGIVLNDEVGWAVRVTLVRRLGKICLTLCVGSMDREFGTLAPVCPTLLKRRTARQAPLASLCPVTT